MVYHLPALLNESIEGLNIRPEGIYVDVTFGGGGHSGEILKQLTTGKLIVFDQDEDAKRNVPADDRILFLNQNFRFLRNNLRFNGVENIDGLIADLGVSFHQFDDPSRGFTFRSDAALDMRMNKSSSFTAADILGTYEEETLANIFYEYGELTDSRRIARAVVQYRSGKPLLTVNDFFEALARIVPFRQEHKFYARVFQALRIEVNHEIDNLKEMLLQVNTLMKAGGRLVVITYHSLEDRVVKNFIRTGNFEGIAEKDFYGNLITPFKAINKKVIVPDEGEIEENNRARSARLRIAEKN